MDTSEVRELFDRDIAAASLGIKLVDCGEGHATLSLTVNDSHLNFNGTCHGGVVFTLADAAFGLACNSHGPVAAAINANIGFHAATQKGETLTAVARETVRDKKLSTYDVTVRNEEDRIIASFSGTSYITRRSHETPVD